MKDKKGNSIGMHCIVTMTGSKHKWTVMGFDGFGGLDIKCNVTAHTLSRHPSTLTVVA